MRFHNGHYANGSRVALDHRRNHENGYTGYGQPPPATPPTGVRLLLHHPMHKIIKFTHDS